MFQIQVYSSILEGISPFKYIQVFSRTLRTLSISPAPAREAGNNKTEKKTDTIHTI